MNLEEWKEARAVKLAAFCPDHAPGQLRNGLPPICGYCGFGENFEPIDYEDRLGMKSWKHPARRAGIL